MTTRNLNITDILYYHESKETKPIMLDFGEADMLPAGTLINSKGKAVNDHTALGILLYDVWKGRGSGQGVMLIGGHVDLAKAQENCGQTYSSEAMESLKRICFVRKAPEEKVLIPPTTVNFADHDGEYVQEQDSTFIFDLNKSYKVIWDGVEYVVDKVFETSDGFETIYIIGNGAGFELEDNGLPFVIVTGAREEGNVLTAIDWLFLSGQTDEPANVTFSVIEIEKQDSPSGGSGGGVMMVEVSVEAVDPSTMEFVNVTADKTFEEIEDCITNGGYAVMAFVSPDNGNVIFVPLTVYIPSEEPRMVMFEGTADGFGITVGMTSDGEVEGVLAIE